MEQLKPCPFCGGEAEVVFEIDGTATVECIGCGAMVDGIERWNARWDYYGDVIECYECAIGGKEAAQRSVEENIRAQGYVKERTCHNVSEWREEFECSECGDVWIKPGVEPFCYCPSCGAKVVEE